MYLKRCLSFLTRTVFPSHCLLCEGLLDYNEQRVCQVCVDTQPICNSLDLARLTPLASNLGCTLNVALINTPSVSKLCYSLKYGSNPWLGVRLGEYFLSPMIEKIHKSEVVLIPMPVSRKRRRRRGYNQCDMLAKGCKKGVAAAGVCAEILAVLEKNSHRKSQIHFDPFQRWTNAKGTFSVIQKKQRIPKDALLVLIDDTVTTGSTLIHAAEALRDSFPINPLHLIALAVEL